MNIKSRRGKDGFITLATLAVLLIIFLLVTINTSTLARLRREVKEVEKRQAQRTALSTNQPAAANRGTNAPQSR